MVRKSRRSARQEAKAPDQFITTSTKIYLFVHEHERPIIYAVIAVVAALAVFLTIRYIQKSRELKAVDAFYEAVKTEEGETTPAEDREAKLRSFLKQYSRTALGPAASLYLGDALYEQGKYAEAIEVYEQTLGREDLPQSERFLAKLGIAFSYENMREYQKALGELESMAQEFAVTGQLVVAMAIARNYEQLGQKEEALKRYRDVKERFPAAVFSEDVDGKILELERALAAAEETEGPAEEPAPEDRGEAPPSVNPDDGS